MWQVKDALVDELSARDKTKAGAKQAPSKLPKASSKYSRLEADISSMQRDSATYCEEPADSEDYQAWRAGFDLSSYRPAVEALTQENAFMAELQARIVPIIVEYDAFWTRYFYQLHLLEVSNALLCAASQMCDAFDADAGLEETACSVAASFKALCAQVLCHAWTHVIISTDHAVSHCCSTTSACVACVPAHSPIQ